MYKSPIFTFQNHVLIKYAKKSGEARLYILLNSVAACAKVNIAFGKICKNDNQIWLIEHMRKKQ